MAPPERSGAQISNNSISVAAKYLQRKRIQGTFETGGDHSHNYSISAAIPHSILMRPGNPCPEGKALVQRPCSEKQARIRAGGNPLP